MHGAELLGCAKEVEEGIPRLMVLSSWPLSIAQPFAGNEWFIQWGPAAARWLEQPK